MNSIGGQCVVSPISRGVVKSTVWYSVVYFIDGCGYMCYNTLGELVF